MSSTVDANVLLYASDTSSPNHEAAKSFLAEQAKGPDLFYLFWPTIIAYLRIATHTAIFEDPLEPEVAAINVEKLMGLPHVRTGSETGRFWAVFRESTRSFVVRGNLVSDAHLVALMREHGVGVIWSSDRDLRKFDGVRVMDPFEEPHVA